MASCFPLVCSPGCEPTYCVASTERGAPMEVWGDMGCSNCLPCEFLIDSENKIFKQRIDPLTQLPFVPTQWEYTGHTTTEFLGEATELVDEMLRERGWYYGVCLYQFMPPCRCGCEGTCACGVTIDFIDLSYLANVQSIEAVVIDGHILPELAPNGRRNWELVGCRYLVKRDPYANCSTSAGGSCGECNAPGSATQTPPPSTTPDIHHDCPTCRTTHSASSHSDRSWPSSQRIDLPLGDPCTWGIRYRAGTPVPPSVRKAVQCVACTLMKDCLGLPCGALPDGVQSISQFGVNVSFSQLQRSIDETNDTFGCAAVRRMLATHKARTATGWGDPLAGNPTDFLYSPTRV